jgi:redox-sensitive bicupin YhaK (pirin superfamily)
MTPLIRGKEHDLGGFFVRRVLPQMGRRTLGPFVFFDHMGPADFPPGKGITVRPHPHIHLATVTYLFEGAIQHKDSLGNDVRIEPGAINWMTAGRGIVHSERAPADKLQNGGKLHGIQLWVGLPEAQENCEPTFRHFESSRFPLFQLGRAHIRLLLGKALGHESPVPLMSDLFYLDVSIPRGECFHFPADERESGAYVVEGKLQTGDTAVERYSMAYIHPSTDFHATAAEDSRFVLLGGLPLGPRFIEWNFVSSDQRNIEEAKRDWRMGPGTMRFPKIPGDDSEFIPLP